MNFNEIIGLEDVKSTLKRAVSLNHFAHASLFYGKEGAAGLPLAVATAQYIHCSEPNIDGACGLCTSCIQYRKLQHPDFHLYFPTVTQEKIDKEDIRTHLLPMFRSLILEKPYAGIQDWGEYLATDNKQFQISVDEARSMLRSASLSAYLGGAKVILIWLPEYMHTAAANAILKVLEEPPAKTYFLLVSTDMDKLLATILSRCQLVPVPRFSDEEIVMFLESNHHVPKQKAIEVARIADGALNNALAILNDNHIVDNESLAQMLRWCFGKKIPELLQFTDELARKGREYQKQFLLHAVHICRFVMLELTESKALIKLSNQEAQFVANLSKIMSIEKNNYLIELLSNAHSNIERNGNPRILFFELFLKICRVFEKP